MIRKSTQISRSTACHPWESTIRASRDRARSRSMLDSSFRTAKEEQGAMFKMKACLLCLVAGLIVAACTDLSTNVEDAIGEDVTGDATARQVAEARFLRAFFAFYGMDLFGQVPFRPSNAAPSAIPTVMQRPEAFDFIVQDLRAARPVLPNLTSGADAGTASKEAVDF